MTLLITVNKKLARLIAGEEEELCLLISKVIMSIVVIGIVLMCHNTFITNLSGLLEPYL